MFEEELAVLAAPGIGSLEQAVQGGIARIVVLRAGCSYRQRLEMLLARRGIAVPRLMEFGTLEAIFGCVSAGLGITLLPRALIGPVWADGRVSLHRSAAGGSHGDNRFHPSPRSASVECTAGVSRPRAGRSHAGASDRCQ